MKSTTAPIPEQEEKRLAELRSHGILDSLPEIEYDEIAGLASTICDTPIALVSLIDEHRQWFKANVGLDTPETARDISFCQYAIMDDELFEVQNAATNERFAENVLVTGEPKIRFYAGAPLTSSNGNNFGTLCVIDKQPKALRESQKEALKALAKVVVRLIESRRTKADLQVYKQFFDMNLDMLCVAGTDTFFKKLNPAFTNILGWEPHELLGKSFVEFIHPDDLPATYVEVDKLAHGASTIDFINRYRMKNGGYKYLSWRSSPDESGTLYAIARDVSDTYVQRKNNEAELKAINNSVVRIECDSEGHIVNANYQFALGLGMDISKVYGKSIEDLLHEDQDRETNQRHWQQLLEGKSVHMEIALKTGSGNAYWLKGAYFPVGSIDGQTKRIIGIAYDITANKIFQKDLARTNQELAERTKELEGMQMLLIQAEKLDSLGRLAAGVAHEVRNPLHVLRMGIDFFNMARDTFTIDQVTMLELMDEEVIRADEIIGELVNFSRKQGIELKLGQVNDVFEHAMLVLRHRLKINQIKIETQFDWDLPEVMLDIHKLEQVVINLMNNAMQAMKGGGTMTLKSFSCPLETIATQEGLRRFERLRTSDEVVVLEVRDTGSGIPAEHLRKLFDPFFTTKPAGEGTGLGLSVCKTIIDLHYGNIEIENVEDPSGARARVYLKIPTEGEGETSPAESTTQGETT